MDIDVSEEEREFVGLNPATHYLLEVRIGNGLMVNMMEFIVATSMGKLGSNGIGEVGNKMRGFMGSWMWVECRVAMVVSDRYCCMHASINLLAIYILILCDSDNINH